MVCDSPLFPFVNCARDLVLYDPLNYNFKYMVIIIKTCIKLFLSLTYKYSFFFRSDANRNKAD